METQNRLSDHEIKRLAFINRQPTLWKIGALKRNFKMIISWIAGNPLKSIYYNISWKTKCDSLKNNRIGQSAAKLL